MLFVPSTARPNPRTSSARAAPIRVPLSKSGTAVPMRASERSTSLTRSKCVSRVSRVANANSSTARSLPESACASCRNAREYACIEPETSHTSTSRAGRSRRMRQNGSAVSGLRASSRSVRRASSSPLRALARLRRDGRRHHRAARRANSSAARASAADICSKSRWRSVSNSEAVRIKRVSFATGRRSASRSGAEASRRFSRVSGRGAGTDAAESAGSGAVSSAAANAASNRVRSSRRWISAAASASRRSPARSMPTVSAALIASSTSPLPTATPARRSRPARLTICRINDEAFMRLRATRRAAVRDVRRVRARCRSDS